MKWYIALLLFCFTFSTLAPYAEGRGRSKSRSASVKKRSASAPKPRAARPKPKAKPRSASVPNRSKSIAARRAASPSPVRPQAKIASRSVSPSPEPERTVTKDQIHSQPVRESGGVVTPKAPQQNVKYTSNKTLGVKQKTFYRGVKDVNNLPKAGEKSYVDNAFKNGIPSNARIKENVPGVHDPKAPTVSNVWQHQNKSAQNSAFVATTSSKKVAAQKYSGPSGGYFEIKPKNSTVIDVNKTVGNSTDKAKLKDKEYLFPNEVPSKEIKAFHKVDNNGKVVESTPNPFYGSN